MSRPTAAGPTEHDENRPAQLPRATRRMRWRVIAATWLSYAGFYFCRKNYSIVKSSLLERFRVTKTALAHIFTVYLGTYMLGQFAMGFLGHSVGTRRLLLGGMVTTLLCNIGLGIASKRGPAGYAPSLGLMGINGFAQATGWPGNVGTLGNWLRRHERGRYMAAWGTCYQIGSIFAKVFATFMLGLAGAQWSFYGGAAVMVGVIVFFYFNHYETPEHAGLDPIVGVSAPADGEADDDAPHTPRAGTRWDRGVIITVVLMGACYFVFKFLRYALDSWSPLAIEKLFTVPKTTAGYVSTLFDWVGFVGVLVSGWVSDRVFKGQRYQTIVLMTIGMAIAFGLLWGVGLRSLWIFAACLAMCGFMLFGPDALLSGVGAIDVGGTGGGGVLAAGLINGIGSIGPVFQEEIIGVVLDRWGYSESLILLAGVSVLGVGGTLYLASRSRRKLSSL